MESWSVHGVMVSHGVTVSPWSHGQSMESWPEYGVMVSPWIHSQSMESWSLVSPWSHGSMESRSVIKQFVCRKVAEIVLLGKQATKQMIPRTHAALAYLNTGSSSYIFTYAQLQY